MVLCFATVCQNLGSCLVGIGGVASTIKSFPVSQRGAVTGLVKTGNGIASGIYTQLYLGFICEHTHALASGVAPGAVMAELMMKEGGTCKGAGGSMHIFDRETYFQGGWALVSEQLP